MNSARVPTRLRALEKSLGPWCHACAHRRQFGAHLFHFNGVLQTADGVPVAESELAPCPVCGKGGVRKVMDGVNPGAMLGIHVVVNVDPSLI